uniref:TNF family profile domain-containing protein n=1 Tax=Oryzias latipes TaxID=8090 RepID=A0A3P9IGK9_ORYLA
MSVDTERAAHTRMEEQSRTSHKYLLLQVWCGLLTVSMVTMGAFLTTLKPKSAEDGMYGVKPVSISPADDAIQEHLKAPGRSLSFIEVTPSLDGPFWEENLKSDFSTLSLLNNSIYSTRKSHYFVYAQVTFRKDDNSPNKSVILIRNASPWKKLRVLAEARPSAGGLVWMGRIIVLAVNDSISLKITGHNEKENTFWGAYQLQ